MAETMIKACDFYVSPDGDHASETWEPLLLLLQEDHHLPIYGGLRDGAKPYPGTIQEIVEEAKRFSETDRCSMLTRAPESPLSGAPPLPRRPAMAPADP
ncbi:MAG: hypothetical protein MAG451_01405 [Anaerolineales bacterium]|nr:hypothetical protein [Anaerolineales bacterium]